MTWPPPYDQSYMEYSPSRNEWYFIRRVKYTPIRPRVYYWSQGKYYYSDSSMDGFDAGKTFEEATARFWKYFHPNQERMK